MARKVILYNPKAVFWTMPLALMAVGSALDRQRYQVLIVDGRFQSLQTLLTELEGALCLGMSVLTGAPMADALAVTRLVRETYPELPIIWGGWHPSLFPEMCLAEANLTAAVIGQGENTFAELLSHLEDGASLQRVAGCVIHGDVGQPVRTPTRPMNDVNSFPMMDYSLIDIEAYFHAKGRRQLDYISSQGCRFRCNFCADPAVYKRGWSGFEPPRMVAEIEKLWQAYRFTDLGLQDETFFTRTPRVYAIAEGFLQTGRGFTWAATMRADQGRRMDDLAFKLCKQSGLRQVIIGLEAGAQQTIDWIQKDIKVEDMWSCCVKLIKHGIGAIINVIVGFPDEPAESVAETLRVARELRKLSPLIQLSVFYFKPYPGNPIAARLEADGFAFPEGLEAWAEFDYVGQGNQWLSTEQSEEIENFKFYQTYAYDTCNTPLKWPLKWLARMRLEGMGYRFPIEKKLIRMLRPPPALS